MKRVSDTLKHLKYQLIGSRNLRWKKFCPLTRKSSCICIIKYSQEQSLKNVYSLKLRLASSKNLWRSQFFIVKFIELSSIKIISNAWRVLMRQKVLCVIDEMCVGIMSRTHCWKLSLVKIVMSKPPYS